jgi:hypothetical protein
MNSYRNRLTWVLTFGLSVSVATTALTTHAGQPKAKDLAALEAKQVADEEAREAAEGETGKLQRSFGGTFALLAEPDGTQKLSSEVIGSFITDTSDATPGRAYLVKVDNGNKTIIEALRRGVGKKLRVTGKLRNIGEDGQAKYLIVSSVVETAATPPAANRRKRGGV